MERTIPNIAERYTKNVQKDLQTLAATGKVSRAGFLRLLAPPAVLTATGLSGCGGSTEEEKPGGLLPTLAPPLELGQTPDAIESEVETESRKTSPFKNPETGIYNPEALGNWTELEQQPLLNEKLGICILPSRVARGEGTIRWHAEVAKRLGFQKVAIVASPPEFADHTGVDSAVTTSLDKLLEYQEYRDVFKSGFKQVHITHDVANGANGWAIPGSDFTEEQLSTTYEETKRAADFLLRMYGNEPTEIVMGGPNEIELLMKGGYNPSTEDADISQQAFDNAVKYLNAVHRAIRDANADNPNANPIKTGVEVLQIREESDRDAKTGLDVIQALDTAPDYVTLSAWQFSGKADGGYWTREAVELIKQSVPESEVMLTEYGVADSDRGVDSEEGRESVAQVIKADTESALSAGAGTVYQWGLTGFNSENNFPNIDDMRGLGLIRPDGSIRKEVYNVFREMSGLEKIEA